MCLDIREYTAWITFPMCTVLDGELKGLVDVYF